MMKTSAVIGSPGFERDEDDLRWFSETTFDRGSNPASGGPATPKAIAGARPVEIPGMGHDLPHDAWPQIIDAIAENAARGTDDA